MNILFISNTSSRCGVNQYGKRLFEILSKMEDISFVYFEVNEYKDYLNVIKNNYYDAILYNYHNGPMRWLNKDNIQKKTKNIGLQHDSPPDPYENVLFDIVLRLDVTLIEDINKYNITRPIYENVNELIEKCYLSDNIKEFIEYKEDNVPIFGSFGFAGYIKNYEKIVEIINQQYDRAIIKIIMPKLEAISDEVLTDINIGCNYKNVKPGIKLMITSEFIDNYALLKFLGSNTLNIFLYDKVPYAGLSSVIDYALSVNRPIAVSDSNMYRHIYSDDICIYKRSVDYIINNSKEYLDYYRKLHSNENLREKIKNIIIHL